MANTTGKKFGGRKKGTPNKTTAEVKKALCEAFEKLGGVPALVEWGKENQTEFYKLWVKLIPVQQNVPADATPVKIEIVNPYGSDKSD